MTNKIAVIGVCAGSAIGGLIFSELNLSLAAIHEHLPSSLGQLQWVINTYGIVVSSTLVLFGRMGDIFGRKRLFLISLILLGLSMFITGIAHNIHIIIAAQILNGASSAILMPVSQAMLSNLYHVSRRSKAIGLWSASTGIAVAIGPLYSGYVIHALSWRWVFLLNVPMVALSFILVFFSVKDSRSDEVSPKLDWIGSALLFVGLASFVMMIIQSVTWPFMWLVVLFIVSIVSFITLFFVEKVVAQPIIREELFNNRAFLVSSLCNCCLLFFIWADFFLMPLYLQDVVGYTPLHTGWLMMLVTIPLVSFSMRSEFFYNTFGPKKLIIIGCILLILSAVVQFFFNEEMSMMRMVVASLAFGLAWALIWNPSATKAVSTLPLRHAGIASGTFVTFQEVGGSFGLAITGAVAAAHKPLIRGFHFGMGVLIIVSFLALITALMMKKAPHMIE